MSDPTVLRDDQRSPANDQTTKAAPEKLAALVQRLSEQASEFAKNTELERKIERLVQGISQPDMVNDPRYLRAVAWALQDMERLAGPITTLPAALRSEMTDLATSYPNVRDQKVQTMLQSTPMLADQSLVERVRNMARSDAKNLGSVDPTHQQLVDGLAQSVEKALQAGGAKTQQEKIDRPAAAFAAPDAKGAPSEMRKDPPAAEQQQKAAVDLPPVAWEKTAKAEQEAKNSPGNPQTGQPNANAAGQASVRGPGVFAQIVSGMVNGVRDDATIAREALQALFRQKNTENPTMQPPATPMADRLRRMEETIQRNENDLAVNRAEASQQAAVNALNSFSQGAGTSIINKIQDAAAQTPGGMTAVLSEMRDGGAFADLRAEFNNGLATDKALAASYERVTGAMAQYGKDRGAIAGFGGEPAISGRLEQMDGEIGKMASLLPSREDGKSVLDDLGEKVREMVNKAVEAVKSVFTPNASRSASASPSP